MRFLKISHPIMKAPTSGSACKQAKESDNATGKRGHCEKEMCICIAEILNFVHPLIDKLQEMNTEAEQKINKQVDILRNQIRQIEMSITEISKLHIDILDNENGHEFERLKEQLDNYSLEVLIREANVKRLCSNFNSKNVFKNNNINGIELLIESIKSTEDYLQKHRLEISTCEVTIKQLEEAIEEHSRELESFEEKCDSFEIEKQDSFTDISRLSSQLSNYEHTCYTLSCELEHNKDICNELEKQNTCLLLSKSTINKEIASFNGNILDLAKTLNTSIEKMSISQQSMKNSERAFEIGCEKQLQFKDKCERYQRSINDVKSGSRKAKVRFREMLFEMSVIIE